MPGCRRVSTWGGVFVALTALASMQVEAGDDYVVVPAGRFQSALSLDGPGSLHQVKAFAMRIEPVNVGEYLAFVRLNPQWQRGNVADLLAGPNYLAPWASALDPGMAPNLPVTSVSWFAARAYCTAEQARLPDWTEWEYAAAADETRRDARRDASRNGSLLTAVLTGVGSSRATTGQHAPNVYGLRDLNRLIWEWTGDYAAMFPNADSRASGGAPSLALCGGSALAFADKNEYALMMRVATLSALKPADSTAQVGFRCVRDLTGEGR